MTASGSAAAAEAEPGAPRPMPPLDAWLYRHQADGGLCMTFGLLAWFDGTAPALPELRERVRERWGDLPRLRTAPVDGAWPRWAWAAHDADPDHHVVAAPRPCSAGVAAHVAGLLAGPLDAVEGRPLWRLHLIPAPGGFALLLRAHHALLDGRSLITLLRALLDGPGAPPAARTALPPAAPTAPLRAQLRAAAALLPAGRRLPFHAPVDDGRALAWSELPVSALHAAREALPGGRASVNAVFLAATAAALSATGTLGPHPGLPGVCAMVPVDLRTPRDESRLGNHYATVRIPLPTASATGPERLAAVDRSARRATRRLLAPAQAVLVARTPPRRGPVRDALARYADSPHYSSLLCTNVRTGAGALALGPAAVTRVALVPALSPDHPLAVSLTTHGPTSVVTVLTDSAHRSLGQPLADRIRSEVFALRPAARPRPGRRELPASHP